MLENKFQKRIPQGFQCLRKGKDLKHANPMYKGKKGQNILKIKEKVK